VRPAFAQQGSFLDQEAGFAAWAQAKGSVNLNLAARRLKNIDTQTNDYLVGEIEVTSQGAISRPHVYVSTGGLIVAYYFRDQPAASAWNTDKMKPPDNFLAMALREVAAAGGLATPLVSYYDFGNPLANAVVAIYGTSATEVMVPNDIQVYEASLAYGAPYCTGLDLRHATSGGRKVSIPQGSFTTFTSLRALAGVPRHLPYETYCTWFPMTVAVVYR
jgi:hypothetical protein